MKEQRTDAAYLAAVANRGRIHTPAGAGRASRWASPRLSIAAIAVALALSIGCSPLLPYTRPAAELTEGQRLMLYSFHKVDAGLVVKVGGNPLLFPHWLKLEAYYRASGAPEPADLMARWRAPFWLANALVVASIPLLVWGVRRDGNSYAVAAPFWYGLGMYGVALGVDVYGRVRFLWPAAEAFNDYLARDLRLSSPP